MAANGPTLLLNPHSGAFVLGMVLWAIGSGGRGVVIVLESAWMVIALGCWSSRTWIDGNLMLNYDCQLKFNYAYV